MKEYSINEYKFVTSLDYRMIIPYRKRLNTIWFKSHDSTLLGVLLNDLCLCDIDLYLRLTVEFSNLDLIIIPFHKRIEIYEKKNN